MTRIVRSLISVTTAAFSFGLALWLYHFFTFDWLPHAGADRWVVATGFASVVAGATFAALPSSSDDDESSSTGQRFSQRAKASDRAGILQIGGSVNPPEAGKSVHEIPGRRNQRAKASGSAQIAQIGGDHNGMDETES